VSSPSPIPLSPALAEADPRSLNDLMGLDPEDPEFMGALPRIVQALRAQAERFALAEGASRQKAPKIKEPKGPELPSTASSDDLGF